MLGSQRPHGMEQPQPFSPRTGWGSLPDGRIHRQQRDDLQQMVLHHIANRADFFVEPAARTDAEVLGHRDLRRGR